MQYLREKVLDTVPKFRKFEYSILTCEFSLFSKEELLFWYDMIVYKSMIRDFKVLVNLKLQGAKSIVDKMWGRP